MPKHRAYQPGDHVLLWFKGGTAQATVVGPFPGRPDLLKVRLSSTGTMVASPIACMALGGAR